MSTKALTKAAAKRQNLNDPSLLTALQNGGPMVWLSCLIMGLGNIMAGQVIKGLIFLLIEAGIIVFLALPTGGFHWISLLPSLGDQVMGEVYNEKTGIYEYTMGDQSQLILLYGIASLCVVALLVFVWQMSVRSGYKALTLKKMGKKVLNFKEDLATLLDENIHKLLMILPTACIAIFTILPLLYMMSMAFTNYSKETDNLVLFDWVGIKNFSALFDSGNAIVVLGGSYGVAATIKDGKGLSFQRLFKSLFTSVPFLFYVALIALKILKINIPTQVVDFVQPVANANAFLAMLMIGVGFELSAEKSQIKKIIKCVLLRYSIGAVFAIAAYFYMPFSQDIRNALVLLALSPVGSSAPIFTQMLGEDEGLSSAVNSICILISVVINVVLLTVVL